MSNTTEWYRPTEDEAEEIGRAGMAAAWKELQPLKDDELPTSKKVLACLRAFKAAWNAALAAEKKLKEAHPEAKYVSHTIESTAMVCSAFMGLEMDGPDDIHPDSVLGARLSAFLQAARALEGMSAVYSAFEEDDGLFGEYLPNETTTFVEAVIDSRQA